MTFPNDTKRLHNVATRVIELEDENKRLQGELAERDKIIALARRATIAFTDPEGRMPANTGEFNDLAEALAAIDDSKLVEGMVLCDAETVENAKKWEAREAKIKRLLDAGFLKSPLRTPEG